MPESPPQSGKIRPRKAKSQFDIDPPRRFGRTSSLDVLDSELIRSTLKPYHPSKNSTDSKVKSDFYKFPAELREMIFMEAFRDEWTGKTPALIKAVRMEDQIYAECMDAWYKQNHTYVLHAKNNWSFLDMKPHAIATIAKIKIMIDENIALHPLLRWVDMQVVQTRAPMSLNDLAITAALATSVTSITLDCRPTCTNLYYWYPQKFSLFFSGFKRLKYAAVTCPIRPNARPEDGGVGSVARIEDGMISSQWQEKTMANGIEEANSKLGSKVKLDRVYVDKFDILGKRLLRKFEDRDMWVWVAEEGKHLKPVVLPDGLKMERY
ncbi:hypothetical protein BKA65DRAFT_472453 [Rhexocercosporidium sp. MPI-PUGE-AT-0058]|nr:hypothetical protein BKA65DRAFT_472453 [Rhexocercosporidium sp. MPI-PUGE-AT-0058]